MPLLPLARRATGVGLILVAGLLAGCGSSGPKRYGVSGTVTWKGQPVKSGTINFRAENGECGGAQITDGKYEIPAAAGLPEGKYQVAISYPNPKAPAPKEDEAPGEFTEPADLLPDRYHENTELTAEINPESSNDVSFDLK